MSIEQPQEPKRSHGTLYIWALGVGIVVCGQYFGWSGGLKDNGPMAMLIASLIVCLLFLAWVLTLAELSVAMPHAGGPLDYGRRAGGNLLGFIMGWSMLLECQFGAIATALASGSAMAFLFSPFAPDPYLAFWAGIATVVIFFFFQAMGFRDQAWIQIAMTCAALAGLCLYWSIAATNFSWNRAWLGSTMESPLHAARVAGLLAAPMGQGPLAATTSLAPAPDLLAGKGWGGVLDAIPFALWWLIIIEGVALAVGLVKKPERSIPRGLVFGMVTVIAMMLLTLCLGCAALDWRVLMNETAYPLAKVVFYVLKAQTPLFYCFAGIALFGLIASYHGLSFSASHQAKALGQARFLPEWMGQEHVKTQAPTPALLTCGLVTAGFLVAGYLWLSKAIEIAILTAGLSSLIWYVLAMFCLFILRRREPGMFRQYQAPLRWTLPMAVLILSIVTICVYPRMNILVLPLTAMFYLVGIGCFLFYARKRFGVAHNGEQEQSSSAHKRQPMKAFSAYRLLESLAAFVLVILLLAIGWIILATCGVGAFRLENVESEVFVMLGIVSAALVLVGVVALVHTRIYTGRNDVGKSDVQE